MAKCPNCGTEVSKPERAFKNRFFHVEAYNCTNCGHNFKFTG
jgi:predicted RNA-binding Zn-ribbon protein involved in translation (DUF1610 family)